jgi:RNA polymerase sigma-70 factor (ECF subfamily)
MAAEGRELQTFRIDPPLTDPFKDPPARADISCVTSRPFEAYRGCDVDTDEQCRLVERAREGDADAWERLYRNIYPRLRAYAARHGGAGVAEDLVNETMARAVAGMGKFQWQSAGFDAWLFGILRWVCSEHRRRAGRRREQLRREQSHCEGAGAYHQPGDDLELAEDHVEVRMAFERLKPAERELLELRVMAGLSADEVAVVLGKRAGAVRTAQSRALAHLRELMEQHR